MTKKLDEMNEDEKKALRKRLYDRCYKRLTRAGFDPKKDAEDFAEKLESCIRTEQYRHKISIAEGEDPKPRRPSQEEVQLDIMRKQLSDLEWEREQRRERALDDIKDIRALEGLDRALREWGSNEEEPDRETQMKEMSEKLNERLIEQTDRGICERCKSSVCRCQILSNGGEENDE